MARRRSAERGEWARARCAPHSPCGTHLCKAIGVGVANRPAGAPAVGYEAENGRRAIMSAFLQVRAGLLWHVEGLPAGSRAVAFAPARVVRWRELVSRQRRV